MFEKIAKRKNLSRKNAVVTFWHDSREVKNKCKTEREGITKIHFCYAEPCLNSVCKVKWDWSFPFRIEGKWRPKKNSVV